MVTWGRGRRLAVRCFQVRKRIRADVPNIKFYSGSPINKCSRSIINMVGQFQSNSTDLFSTAILLARADTVALQGVSVKTYALSPRYIWCQKRDTTSVAEWLRAWDTLTKFEPTVCGRS